MFTQPLRKSVNMALSHSIAHRKGWEKRATSPKPTAIIPKKDGGKRIIHVYGDNTEIGQDAQLVAQVLKPIVEAAAQRRFANGGVIWSPNSSVMMTMAAHRTNPYTWSADLAKAFWQVPQRAVYRLLRGLGLTAKMAALVSRQMCDRIPGKRNPVLTMGHPLSPAMLALWVSTVARRAHQTLHLLGATVTWYADNVSISVPKWVDPRTIAAAWAQTPLAWKKTIRQGGGPPKRWTLWRGRELGLVRIGHSHMIQPHGKSRGLRSARRTLATAIAILRVDPRTAERLLAVARGRFNWYNTVDPFAYPQGRQRRRKAARASRLQSRPL